MSQPDFVAELLLSLLGEPNFFLKLSIVGNKFTIENRSEFSGIAAQRLDNVCSIATNIRSIDTWKREIKEVDSVKRAYVDAICQNYSIYLNIVDTMRMNHLSGSKVATIDSVMEFVLRWHERINYINSLAILTPNQTGFELMNLVFQEWCMQCVADWSYIMLSDVLKKTSMAFHKIASSWLLDGKPMEGFAKPVKNSGSICVEINPKFVPSSLIGSNMLIKKILETGRNIYFLKEFRNQRNYEYRLDERKRILEEAVPLSKDGTKNLEESARLWYDLHYRGRLYSIVDQLSRIVSEDVMLEMRYKQRVLDHIQFVQTHFFLLRGDFIEAIQTTIKDSANKTNRSNLLMSSKGTSTSFVAEACLNYALNGTTLPINLHGLRQYISAERVGRSSQQTVSASQASLKTLQSVNSVSKPATSLNSQTSLNSISSKHQIISGQKGRNLEDLLSLTYKPPSAIAKSVLQLVYLKDYEKIFTRLAPFRLLLDYVDDISLTFARTSKKTFLNTISMNQKETFRFCRFVNFVLFNIRRYLSRSLRKIFIFILPRECDRVLLEMNTESDLHELIRVHEEFLNRIRIGNYVRHITLIRQTLRSIHNLIQLKYADEDKENHISEDQQHQKNAARENKNFFEKELYETIVVALCEILRNNEPVDEITLNQNIFLNSFSTTTQEEIDENSEASYGTLMSLARKFI